MRGLKNAWMGRASFGRLTATHSGIDSISILTDHYHLKGL